MSQLEVLHEYGRVVSVQVRIYFLPIYAMVLIYPSLHMGTWVHVASNIRDLQRVSFIAESCWYLPCLVACWKICVRIPGEIRLTDHLSSK